MDDLKNQLSVSDNQKNQDGFMEDLKSGSGSDSRSGYINIESPKKSRLKIRLKKRESEDCNGESDTVSNETSSTTHHVCKGAKKRVLVEQHVSNKEDGIGELPNYDKRRIPKLKNQRRRSKLRLELSNRDVKTRIRNFVGDESSEEDDDYSSKSVCCMCGKNFPSMKSLFGHMRCHPNRDWRGMIPPSKASVVADKNSPPSSAVSEHFLDRIREEKSVDQGSLLSGWSVTARRGRRTTISESTEISDDHVSFAAHHLMMLAYGDSREVIREEIEDRKMEFGDLGILEEVKLGKPKRRNHVFGSETVKNIGEIELVFGSDKRRRKRKTRALEKVQNLSLIDSKINAIIAGKYKCNTCNKCFPSYQALGGHRTSHKKGRNSNYSSGGIDEFTVDEAAEEDLTHIKNSPESGSDPDVYTVHRCQICNKGFATGQALGGHKRCHWTGDRSGMGELAAASSATSVEIPKDCRKSAGGLLPDFDLNEPPMVEEEDLDSAITMIDVVPASSQPLVSLLQCPRNAFLPA